MSSTNTGERVEFSEGSASSKLVASGAVQFLDVLLTSPSTNASILNSEAVALDGGCVNSELVASRTVQFLPKISKHQVVPFTSLDTFKLFGTHTQFAY